MNIEELKARLAELHETAQAMQAKADAEKRQLSEKESADLDAIFAEFESVEQDIARREKLSAQSQRLELPEPRRTQPHQRPAAGAGAGAPSW
jgi:multidrug resistance efflux pump